MPAEPSPGPEADRLDQVEKKLDRLLQALERKPDQPPLPPAAPTAPAAPLAPLATIRPDQPPVPPRPAAPFGKNSRVIVERLTKGQGTALKGDVVVLHKDGQTMTFSPDTIDIKGPSPDDARLDALEKKVQSLEARLVRLERKLEVGSNSSDVAPRAEPRP